MLWHIRIEPAHPLPDSLGRRLAAQAVESGLAGTWSVQTSRGFLIEGEISREQLDRVAAEVLVDPVVETHTIEPTNTPANGHGTLIHVMPKPGVTDPEGSSALELLKHLGYPVSNVRTIKTFACKARPNQFRGSSSATGQRRRRTDRPRLARSRPARRGPPYRFRAFRCRSVTCATPISCT